MNNILGFQAFVFKENEDDKYRFQIITTGANLLQLSLLLTCVHLIERELIDMIDSIEPEYEVTG
jgi:hypothetical protein